MTTINELLTTLFSDKKRDLGQFRPPPLKQLAVDLDIPLLTFRSWFTAIQCATGRPDWFKLHESHYSAFLDYLACEGLIE